MQPYTSTHKYHGEQDPRYGGKLHWPGANGFPFSGDAAPTLKQHEIDALPPVGAFYKKRFDLNIAEDADYYSWVMDRIQNGMFVRGFKEFQWPDPEKEPIIYMEWTQVSVIAPPHQTSRNGHGSSKQFTLRRPG